MPAGTVKPVQNPTYHNVRTEEDINREIEERARKMAAEMAAKSATVYTIVAPVVELERDNPKDYPPGTAAKAATEDLEIHPHYAPVNGKPKLLKDGSPDPKAETVFVPAQTLPMYSGVARTSDPYVARFCAETYGYKVTPTPFEGGE